MCNNLKLKSLMLFVLPESNLNSFLRTHFYFGQRGAILLQLCEREIFRNHAVELELTTFALDVHRWVFKRSEREGEFKGEYFNFYLPFILAGSCARGGLDRRWRIDFARSLYTPHRSFGTRVAKIAPRTCTWNYNFIYLTPRQPQLHFSNDFSLAIAWWNMIQFLLCS